MSRRADVPDVMTRIAATLEEAERVPARARGVMEPLPEGDADVNVGRLRHLADIDIEFPSGSDRPLVGGAIRLAKRAVRRALRWYMAPLMEQQSRFNHAALDLIERMRLRLARATGEVIPPPMVPETEAPPARYPDVEVRMRAYVPWFRGCRRVLHVECGEGELLAGLVADGTPAYGVTGDEAALQAARSRGFDVVRGDAVAHLRQVAPQSIDGLFWSLVSAPRPPEDLVAVLRAAAVALAPRSTVVIETAGADDLAGKGVDGGTARRPIHPGAVRAALEATGYSGVRVELISPVGTAPAPDEPGATLAEEIERIDDLLTRQHVTTLVATRRRATE